MSDLYNWLSPVKELMLGGENVAKTIVSLVNMVKEKTMSVSCSKPGKAGFPITTAIKLLLAYITPPREARGENGVLQLSIASYVCVLYMCVCVCCMCVHMCVVCVLYVCAHVCCICVCACVNY